MKNPRKKNKTSEMRKEFNRQIEEKTAKFPWFMEGFYVERFDSDKYGDEVRIAGKIESYTANTPEAVREFGNRMKLIAVNTKLFNVMITMTDGNGRQNSRVLPRNPPAHIQNKQQLQMTTDERMREKVQQTLYRAKQETLGTGDFDKKPDVEHVIDDLLDEGEPELD